MFFEVVTFCVAVTLASGLDSTYLPPGPGQTPAPAEARSSTSKFKIIPIVKSVLENEGDGTYSYNYESANGIQAEEKGDVRGDGTKARGSYSFTLPDGQHVSLTYTADENGFVAQGSHIPTPHPIPEAILRALEENAAAEARGIFDDGQYHGEGLEESQYKEEVGNAGVGVISAKAVAQATATTGEGYKY